MYFILGWLGVIFEFHGYNFSCPFLAIQMLWMLLGVDFFVMVSLIHLKKKRKILCCFWHCSWYFFALTACYQISQSIKQQKKPNRVDPKPLFLSWQKTSNLKREFSHIVMTNTDHSGFLEHWNSQKSLCNIWQRFSCRLDEWIEKICNNFFFHKGLYF